MKVINNSKLYEPYCSFEVSELLKERGFWVQTYEKCWVKTLDDEIIYNGNEEQHDRAEQWIMHPTHSVAIGWIRLNFSIDISSHISTSGHFCYEIRVLKSEPLQGWERLPGNYGYRTTQDAIEAALLYTLKDLIK